MPALDFSFLQCLSDTFSNFAADGRIAIKNVSAFLLHFDEIELAWQDICLKCTCFWSYHCVQAAPNPHGIMSSKASGEPAVMAAASVIMAIQQATAAAAKDLGNTAAAAAGAGGGAGDTVFTVLPAPATPHRIKAVVGRFSVGHMLQEAMGGTAGAEEGGAGDEVQDSTGGVVGGEKGGEASGGRGGEPQGGLVESKGKSQGEALGSAAAAAPAGPAHAAAS